MFESRRKRSAPHPAGLPVQPRLDIARCAAAREAARRALTFTLGFALALLAACSTLPPATSLHRTESHALADPQNTPLGKALAPLDAAHPGQTGFRLLTDGTDALYVSVDIDVVNSSDAPATSAPGYRGISARALVDALAIVAGADGLVGLDLCEVNPEFDLSGRTEQLAVDAILAVIGDRIFDHVGHLPAEQLAAILLTP